MSDIVLSAGVRANLLQLQKTSELITQTQTKLATGKRVNSALDNPVNYFTAQGLQNRASDLGNLLDSMSSAFNTIQAANNGITSITKLVQSAQALISRRSDPAKQGEILGVNQSASALARILGPMVAITLFYVLPSHILPYLVGAGLMGIALLLSLRIGHD